MKALLDAMLVLTKQDRLCHVIHATSDPFYQTWLRQLNVMLRRNQRFLPHRDRLLKRPPHEIFKDGLQSRLLLTRRHP